MSTWYEYFLGETIPQAPECTLQYTFRTSQQWLRDIETQTSLLNIVKTTDSSNGELKRQQLMRHLLKENQLTPPKIQAPLPHVETASELLRRTRKNLRRSTKFFVHM